jgi:hypothetical protein
MPTYEDDWPGVFLRLSSDEKEEYDFEMFIRKGRRREETHVWF